MSRVVTFTVALSLIVCALAVVSQCQAAVAVSDEEISGIVVGGPVSECADCREPSCPKGLCYSYFDELNGWKCRQKIDAFGANMADCEGIFFKSPYCHLINEGTCWWIKQYVKSEYFECDYEVNCSPTHSFEANVETHSEYDDCVESDTDPHSS